MAAQLDTGALKSLGIEGITVLAVRPGGYVGLRADRDHLSALERYGALVRTGRPSWQAAN